MKSSKVAKTLATREYAELLADVCLECLRSLKTECSRFACISQIQGKIYHVYRKTSTSDSKAVTRTTRPINSAIFIEDEQVLIPLLERFKEADYETLSEQTITSLIYTIAMSFCAANDLRRSGDKKTPGTFLEFLVAHLVSRQFNVLPRRKVKIPSVEGQICELPTDLIFEPGKGMVKFHVPVKLSTRERSIQAWAHQRVLVGLWGLSAFKGLLVVLTETKLALETLKVTEILLPLQWPFTRTTSLVSIAFTTSTCLKNTWLWQQATLVLT